MLVFSSISPFLINLDLVLSYHVWAFSPREMEEYFRWRISLVYPHPENSFLLILYNPIQLLGIWDFKRHVLFDTLQESRFFKVLFSGQEGQVVKELKFIAIDLFWSLLYIWTLGQILVWHYRGFWYWLELWAFTILYLPYLFQHHPLLLTCDDVPFSTLSFYLCCHLSSYCVRPLLCREFIIYPTLYLLG